MGLTAAFLGVASVYITDGETHLLVDGFFSRPGLWKAGFSRVSPDIEKIKNGLDKTGISKLSAVLVGHSHYDHAFDAAEIALQTEAVLVGSESTLNIGRGSRLSEKEMRLVREREELPFGKFSVTFFPSQHNRTYLARGEIKAPLFSPAHITAYRDGACYSIFIKHPAGSILVQDSAGFLPGALEGVQADTVFLAAAGLGRAPEAYRKQYFYETVMTVGASRVVPIHYDDFTRPLSDPPCFIPRWVDDIPASLQFLEQSAADAGVQYELWRFFDRHELGVGA